MFFQNVTIVKFGQQTLLLRTFIFDISNFADFSESSSAYSVVLHLVALQPAFDDLVQK